MRKCVALLMCFTIFFCFAFSVSANSTVEEFVVREKNAEEITDVDALIALSLSTNQEKRNDDRLVVTQVLNEKEFNNGRKEFSGSVTEIILFDKEANVINAASVRNNQMKSGAGSGSDTNGLYDIAVKYTVYWQYYSNLSADYAKCTTASCQIVGNANSTQRITKLDCIVKQTDDYCNISPVFTHCYVNNPVVGSTYSVNYGSLAYTNITGYFSILLSGVTIRYGTGSTCIAQVDVKQEVRNMLP